MPLASMKCVPTIHLATQPGRGGVCVLILSGPPAQMERADSFLHPRRSLGIGDLVYGWLTDPADGTRIDEVLLAAPQPDQRILTGHGGTAGALAILDFFTLQGFRESPSCPLFAPTPDLPRSLTAEWEELSARLPDCQTETQAALVLQALAGDETARSAVPEMLRPRRWCLCGAPNTGKSSLLNRLTDQQRALVSDQAGTTLDAVGHRLDIGGYDCTVVDTAGFRKLAGATEQEAMRRAAGEIRQADLTACLLDASRPLTEDDDFALAQAAGGRSLLLLLNKTDRMTTEWFAPAGAPRRILQTRFPMAPLLEIRTLPASAAPAASAADGLEQLLRLVISRLGAPAATVENRTGNTC